MTSVTYRRQGCKCHKCSSHLQRGIAKCLAFTRAKLCRTFINMQVLEKKLEHHSSSTIGFVLLRRLGAYLESSLGELVLGRLDIMKNGNFFTCEISTLYVLLSVEVCVLLPLQWRLVHAQLHLDCKGLICNKAAEKGAF